jgi:hypothetical protein
MGRGGGGERVSCQGEEGGDGWGWNCLPECSTHKSVTVVGVSHNSIDLHIHVIGAELSGSQVLIH